MAVLQQRQEETLGFAETSARGHQSVLRAAREKLLKCILLVAVGGKWERNVGEPIPAGALMERQQQRDVGAFEQLLTF